MQTESKSENKVRQIDKKISILEQKLMNEQDQCSISDLAKICETINNLEEQKRRLLRTSGSEQPSDDSMSEEQRRTSVEILSASNCSIRPEIEKLLRGRRLDKNFDRPQRDPITTIEPRIIRQEDAYEQEAGAKDSTKTKQRNTK